LPGSPNPGSRIPESVDLARDYATRTLNLRELIAEKMSKLDEREYEGILRPIFKDDELLIISVGAVLGLAVGELQLLLVEQLAR